MKNTYRVYTIKLARYLTEKGFTIQGTTQDVKNPKLLNWFFTDSEDLRKCIQNYQKERNEYYRNSF